MNEIKKINVDGVDYDIVAKELTKTTYTELKALRDNGQLSEGHLYRITDYVTTTVEQAEIKSAGNVFDVIVLAVSASELSHIARAIQHEGDTYFDGNDLGAWELWYDLDNDTEKYEWADATNGKGVIYRMIDEKRNDCPYDFKNILFYNDKYTYSTTTDKYYYTFSYVVNRTLYDGTVEKQATYCFGNSMGGYIKNKKKALNRNVFRNNSFSSTCYSNTFGTDCHQNTIGNSCQGNTFGTDSTGNTLDGDCRYNTIGNYCQGNIFGFSCQGNIFGTDSTYNTLGNNCNFNIFSTTCRTNTLGSGCRFNTFDQWCAYNTLGDNCNYNTLGTYCQYRSINSERKKTSITLNEEYYDDGSGKLVPIKHPDLSTQPSILPYKFMGQYVYEQLVFLGEYDVENTKISTEIPCQAISVSNPLILRCDGFGYGKYIKGGSQTGPVIRKGITGMPIDLKLTFIQASSSDNIFRVEGSVSEAMANTGVEIVLGINPIKVYAHIVYTSTPEEGGYYGYNNY